MAKDDSFPKDLLRKPKTDRLLYFKNYHCMHPKYNVVYKHLYDAIISSVTPLIIMLYGPTGIGKSTLCNHLKNQLTNEFSGNPGIIPAVYVEVPNQAPKNFDWKFFFRRFLEALDEVLIELKRDLSHPREHNTKLFHHQRSQTIMDLRQSVVSAIRNRKPYVVFLDEAQTIQNIANPKGMEGQMDSIKSLASDTKDFGTKYVLAGVYTLLNLIDLSGQLSHRTMTIHFERYKYNHRDLTDFFHTLLNLTKHMPLREQPDLIDAIDYIYERTLGIVGILKKWLLRALEIALNENAKTVTIGHLQKTALTDNQLLEIINEIKAHENTPNEDHRDEIRQKLGMMHPVKTDPVVPSKKGNSRPGTRKPKRDPVGQAVNM